MTMLLSCLASALFERRATPLQPPNQNHRNWYTFTKELRRIESFRIISSGSRFYPVVDNIILLQKKPIDLETVVSYAVA